MQQIGLCTQACMHGVGWGDQTLCGEGTGLCSQAPRDASQSNDHNTSCLKSPFPGKIAGLFINIAYNEASHYPM